MYICIFLRRHILTQAYNLIRFACVIMLTIISAGIFGHPFSFRKINSGTKADIHALNSGKEQEVFFLTDKIHILEKDTWKKMDFPVEGRIFTFSPVSANDIWFTITQVTSTSLLYHYHDGKLENIRAPFSNFISNIHFVSENSALFAGWADMAVFEKGSFVMLPPIPELQGARKLFSLDVSAFWVLTGNSALFRYDPSGYKSILDKKAVTDFCFTDMQDGYLLSVDELYRVDRTGIKLILKNADLGHIKKIGILQDKTLMMIGDDGLIMLYADGHLSGYDSHCKENLTDLLITNFGDIWICGDRGLLLYSGEKQFPEYVDNNQGFSLHKLITYGINTDDEYGVAMADFNGDDKLDIYAVRIYEQNRLFINNPGSATLHLFTQGFIEEAVKRDASGVINPKTGTSQSELKMGIGAADIDNDGDQDIYLCYLNSINKLLLNKDNDYFRNVSEQDNRACDNMKRSNAAAFADVDNDGDLDLFITNEESSNRLYENNGTGHFTDITATSGLSSTSGGMCASFADVNNDGLPDLCVSFWYPGTKLYFNESGNGRIHFRDVTLSTDLAKAAASKSNAVAFADVNNDGFTDLFVANRNTENKLYMNNGKGLFSDVTEDYFPPENYMSNGAVFADFDLDGFLDLYITNVGENVLYKNINGSYFKDVTADFGAELSGYCTGCVAGDIDNDGDPDLYVANYINGNSNLFLNNTGKKSFVKIKLQGVRSNKDAIGAKIWLYKVTNEKKQYNLAGYREINGGGGYCSVSAKEAIFGVDPDIVYYALVKFPSSSDTLKIDDVVAGKTLIVRELTGFKAFYTESKNQLVRFFKNQENQPEIVKYLLTILLLVMYNFQLRKSTRKIALIRWMASGFIFIIFVFVNQFFFFQWFSTSFFIAPLIVIGLLALLHLFIGRILLRRLAQKEKLELREKLSRDLHDDLASTLGSISIYAETLKGMNEISQPNIKKLPVKIAELSQTAMQSISDIIWMTSPRNDSLQSLISKTSNYMLELLTDNKINFRSRLEIPEIPIHLKENIRNDAFLILKEGLHNIIRHSEAGNVDFFAEINEDFCVIRLKDDGKGLADIGQVMKGSYGNGLVNMHRRAQEAGIEFKIHSREGEGTEIAMKFRI
ncbi:MAG: PDK repeat-containing protein [Bacteroidetes bacterium]|nr:MAG: PDK repeat-containing protein [Bacteroidota bacterium]